MAFDVVDPPDAYTPVPFQQPGDVHRPPLVAGDGPYVMDDDSQLIIGKPVHPGFDGAAAVGDRTAQVAVDQAAPAPVKRKRGRPPKNPGGGPSRTVLAAKKKKEEDEAVCFICFGGGKLVVCDRRDCSKAYHPACVRRDDAFFRTKGRWVCGWHICSTCEKSASYMCYTCTYSLCNRCIRDASILCVRERMGFCETCYETIMSIESGGDANVEKVDIDFDDKNSWHYLFKLYWLALKEKLLLTMEELSNAECPWKSSGVSVCKEESSDELYIGNDEQEESSDSSPVHHENRKRSRKCSNKSVDIIPARIEGNKWKYLPEGGGEWASPQLLEFTAHMRNGDKSVLSQFDVQNLLLEYIKENNLRDPRRKSQIICDTMLQNLFRRQCVGHFEIMKLLESHFLIKEVSQIGLDEKQEKIGHDMATSIGSDKKRKLCKKLEEREPQNIYDYAAIDTHNINLIYLRRNLLEDLIDDSDAFREKVTGAFVRIRFLDQGQKQDMYRLVKIIGTHVVAEKYKVGKKTTNVALDILNLDKTEKILMRSVSNQDFSEEECRLLKQSIKCGLINRLTVGDVLDKAKIFQAVKVNDWLESEKLRLSHLRDRANETGRRKELRECVEKLQFLSRPEEPMRRLNDLPEIHVDVHMDPNYESPEALDTKKGDNHKCLKGSLSRNKAKELWSPSRGSVSNYNWTDEKIADTSWFSNKSLPKEGFQGNLGLDDKLKMSFWNDNQLLGKPEGSCGGSPGSLESPVNPGSLLSKVQPKSNETDSVWHYLDPSGCIQGPFSVIQLRNWSSEGYFPPDLRVWLTSQKQEDSVLLTDALVKDGKDEQQEVQQHNFTPGKHFTDRVGTKQNHLDCSLKGNNAFTSVEIRHNGRRQWSENQGSAAPTMDNDVIIVDRWSSDQCFLNASSASNTASQSTESAYHVAQNAEFNVVCQPVTETLEPKHASNAVATWDSGWNVPKQSSPAADIRSSVSFGLTKAADCSMISSNVASTSSISFMKKSQFFGSACPSATPRLPVQMNEPVDDKKVTEARKASSAQSSRASFASASSVQESGEVAWEKPALRDKNVKTRWDIPGHLNMNANSSCEAPTPGGSNLNTGWNAQPQGNMNNYDGWGKAIKDKVNTSWESTAQKSGEVAWEKPALRDKNVKTRWDIPGHLNMNANSSCEAPTLGGSNLNTRWDAQPQGNMNNYDGWGQAIKDKVNTSWESTAEKSGEVAWEKPALRNKNVKTRWDIPGNVYMSGNSNCGSPEPGKTKPNSGWEEQPRGNMNNYDGWGQAIKGKVNTNWVSADQENGEVTWEMPALQDKNVRKGWDMPGHVNVNATSSCGTPTPERTNLNAGWEARPRGNMNNSDGWGASAPGNKTSTGWGWGSARKVKPNLSSRDTAIQENEKTQSGWGTWGVEHAKKNASSSCGTPAPGRTNLQTGWEAQPSGNMNNSDGWGASAPGNNTSTGWGSARKVKSNSSSRDTAIQENEKTQSGCGTWEVEHARENASSSCGAPAPGRTNLNTGWEAQPSGSMKNSDGWGASAPGNNSSTGWGSAIKVKSNSSSWDTAIRKNEKTQNGWGTWEVEHARENANSSSRTPAPGTTNLNKGWEAQPRGNMNNSDGWGASVPGNNTSTSWGSAREVKPNSSSWDMAIQENEKTHSGWGTSKVEHARKNASSSCGTPAHGRKNLNTGWGAQPRGNMNNSDGWGRASTPGNNTSTGWGSARELKPNLSSWDTEIQENENTQSGWGTSEVQHARKNASSSCGTPAHGRKNLNTGWEAQPRGNLNNSDDWGASAPGNNTSTGWGSTREVKPNSSSWDTAKQGGWGTWEVKHARESVSRNLSEKQGNTNASSNSIWGASLENDNRNSRPRDFDSPRTGRYDRDRYREGNARDSRYRSHSSVGGGSSQKGQRVVCKFYESGHCKRGSACRYLHQ